MGNPALCLMAPEICCLYPPDFASWNGHLLTCYSLPSLVHFLHICIECMRMEVRVGTTVADLDLCALKHRLEWSLYMYTWTCVEVSLGYWELKAMVLRICSCICVGSIQLSSRMCRAQHYTILHPPTFTFSHSESL